MCPSLPSTADVLSKCMVLPQHEAADRSLSRYGRRRPAEARSTPSRSCVLEPNDSNDPVSVTEKRHMGELRKIPA